MAEWAVRAFFIGLGLGMAIWLIHLIREIAARYRQGALWELEQKEKRNAEVINKLSDNDLLKSAIESDRASRRITTDPNNKKG